jgi:hypothetical protein
MSKRDRTPTRGKALDLWAAPKDAGEPLVCIASTFTFDATFFETECVGRFLQMDNHPSESESVAYLVEREEKLSAAKVCALVDRRHARDKESLRWDIIGVLVPKAIQHAKVSPSDPETLPSLVTARILKSSTRLSCQNTREGIGRQ